MVKTLTVILITVAACIGAANNAAAENKNPCGASRSAPNPCAPAAVSSDDRKHIRLERITDYEKLVSMGKKLWNSEALGTSGLSCMSCHADHENLNLDKVKGWPHHVKMTGDILTLDQMVNYCMLNPMAANPLDPNSVEMTAMAAYYREYTASYKRR
ncbi:MAG: hypothetical protein HY751_02100 [Nitrospinae bacterium]|nr:hypothetical protein [Nitrospinota bacterium]